LTRCQQRSHGGAERDALADVVVGLLDRGEIREPEERVGVRAENRLDEAVLHEVSEVILAKGGVAGQEISCGVILTLQRLGRRHSREPAELFFGDDVDLRSRADLQLLRPFQFVAFVAFTKPLCTNDEHRRPGIHILSRVSAESRDKGARILATERAELSGEDDELTR
jgi:hypothetical protein